IGVCVYLWITRRRAEWRGHRLVCVEMLALVASYAVAMGLVSPTSPGPNGIGDLRYLFPVLPFAATALACFFAWLHSMWPRIAMAVLAVTIGTNAFEWSPF